MEIKRFKMIDEPFTCVVCHKEVKPLGISARDHCPYCLCSLHVDINPGDRNNPCKGVLKPVGIDKHKDTFKIVYKCDKCHEMHRNIMAHDDDFNKVLEIMKETS